jgi:ornithine cyclodeaminase
MTTEHQVVYLGEDILEGLNIPPSRIADCIEEAFASQARRQLWTVPKSALMPGDGRYMMTTLSVADTPRYTVIKTAMVSPRNPARGLNGVESSIILLDSETGLLRAVLGGNWITAVRTAGLSAVMARRLANPASSSVAFIGCGVQARSHLSAFNAQFPLTEIRAAGRGQANIDKLCETASALGLRSTICTSPQDAIGGADLIVSSITLSYETAPFLDARWLKPGAFATITDLGIPWQSETLDVFDAAYIDDHEQEASSPKPMISKALVRGDMGEVLCGDVAASYDSEKRSAFLFRGLAIGDFAVSALAYETAMELGVGHMFDA